MAKSAFFQQETGGIYELEVQSHRSISVVLAKLVLVIIVNDINIKIKIKIKLMSEVNYSKRKSIRYVMNH